MSLGAAPLGRRIGDRTIADRCAVVVVTTGVRAHELVALVAQTAELGVAGTVRHGHRAPCPALGETAGVAAFAREQVGGGAINPGALLSCPIVARQHDDLVVEILVARGNACVVAGPRVAVARTITQALIVMRARRLDEDARTVLQSHCAFPVAVKGPC